LRGWWVGGCGNEEEAGEKDWIFDVMSRRRVRGGLLKGGRKIEKEEGIKSREGKKRVRASLNDNNTSTFRLERGCIRASEKDGVGGYVTTTRTTGKRGHT
jgi:hypothetical protein